MGKLVAASYSSAQNFLVLLMVALRATLATSVEAQLVTNFYKSSCPNAETIITSAVNSALNARPAAAPGVLRIHFQDCFVRGCAASVLTDSPSKKDAGATVNSLQAYEAIDAAKTAIEKQCPGIDSCSDISAVASQLSVKKVIHSFNNKINLSRNPSVFISKFAAAMINMGNIVCSLQTKVKSASTATSSTLNLAWESGNDKKTFSLHFLCLGSKWELDLRIWNLRNWRK